MRFSMILRPTLWTLLASGAVLAVPAHATPVCSVEIACTGRVVIEPGNGEGDRLIVGVDGVDGTVAVTSGSVATLEPGTGVPPSRPIPNEVAPRLVVGAGFGGSAHGLLEIDGAGSEFRLDGAGIGAFATIGAQSGGTGDLVVRNGGALTLSGPSITADAANRDVYIDIGNAGGTGEARVDGGMIALSSSSNTGIAVGSAGSGDGLLVVDGGGTVSVTSSGGPSNNGFASIAVGRNDGGNNTGRLEVHDGMVAIAAANGGARLDFGELNSRGDGLISGPNAEIALLGGPDFSIARVGTGNGAVGNLVVEDGGRLSVQGADAAFLSGGQRFGETSTNTAVGQTTIRSGGEIVVDGTDFGVASFGDATPAADSASLATLLVEGAGSRLAATDEIRIGAAAGAGVGSTTAIATIDDGGTLDAPLVRVLDGGVLRGDGGIVTGSLTLEAGGLLSPGLSPGDLLVTGDLLISGGTLQVEIAAGGVMDMLEVLGDVQATSAFDLEIFFTGGFLPEAGQIFSFLQSGGDILGFTSLADISVFGDGGGRWEGALSPSGDSVGFEVTSMAPIPLPAGILGLIAALGMLRGMPVLRRGGRRTLCQA